MIFKKASFKKAKPIFAKGKSLEKNTSLLLKTQIGPLSNVIMRMAGHCSYRIFINGQFVFFGPARAGRDHYRVDELPIGKYLTEAKNDISVILNSYNCNSFYHMNNEGFFACEFTYGDNVLCPTGSGDWKIYMYDERYVRVLRQSFQRPFSEAYDMTKHNDHLSKENRECLECEVLSDKIFIERELSLPEFPYESIDKVYEIGKYSKVKPENYHHDRAYDAISDEFVDGFLFDTLEIVTTHRAQEYSLTKTNDVSLNLPITVKDKSYASFKLKGERTGFLKLTLTPNNDTEIFITHDEILDDEGKINFNRLGCCNVIYYKLSGGKKYTLMTAEPYSIQYINVITDGADIDIEDCGIIRADFNSSEIIKTLNKDKSDEQIERIYNAAVETFRQNTFDIYMDCPSRERAGWLCDSFFTSRVEKLLSGKSTVEHAFLSNFIMDENPKYLPDGMLPMCYPADHADGVFIPNWAMWYVLELREYLDRTSDRAFVDAAKNRMYRVLDYFRKFENEDGLLCKLESWVFLEWSKSNELTQDINYPSNMLYCRFKEILGELYSDNKLIKEAQELKKLIRERSRVGLFFCDNEVYDENGVPHLTNECTESCQYYAFYCGIANVDDDRELWETLVNDFGPDRKTTNKFKEIYFANAFIGNYLRCDLLMKHGIKDKLDQNIRGYFDYMAKRTGTLWENDTPHASCNHGFASHVLIWLDYLGYLN